MRITAATLSLLMAMILGFATISGYIGNRNQRQTALDRAVKDLGLEQDIDIARLDLQIAALADERASLRGQAPKRPAADPARQKYEQLLETLGGRSSQDALDRAKALDDARILYLGEGAACAAFLILGLLLWRTPESRRAEPITA